MAEHQVHGPSGGVHAESSAAGHEVTDVDANPLAKVGIAIASLVLVSFILMVLLFRTFAYYQPLFDDDPHPLRAERAVSSEPRLQPDPPRQLGELRQIEDHVLSTYDWVDREQRFVRIPVGRAIDLLVERGLPRKTGTGAVATEPARETGGAN